MPREPGVQQVHFKLREDTHRKLRVRAAARGVSMQEYVESLLEDDLKGVSLEGL